MSTDCHRARRFLDHLLAERNPDEIVKSLNSNFEKMPPFVPRGKRLTMTTLEQRWEVLATQPEARDVLLDPRTLMEVKQYKPNIENFIGSVKVPVGLAGPLRINGLFSKGDYYIPLATTEGALVASYDRGARLISKSGGCSAVLLNEGISRTPAFAFKNLEESGVFVAWALSKVDEFRREANATTHHGKFIDMRISVEGNHVYLSFEFTTGDASGQNMISIATQAICAYIDSHSPVRPQYSFVEANLSSDKKASAKSFSSVRGKKVTAEVILPSDLVEKILHTTSEKMVNYWRMAAIGGVLSGTIGIQGHYANGLAALYLACGQDVACVAESAVGVTRLELTPQNELYAAVTMPNLMVGTIGGGTNLPSQQVCLKIMGLAGPGNARALAEVCASLCLAGELSLIGSICAGDFTRAHQRLARLKRRGDSQIEVSYG